MFRKIYLYINIYIKMDYTLLFTLYVYNVNIYFRSQVFGQWCRFYFRILFFLSEHLKQPQLIFSFNSTGLTKILQ